MEQLQSSSSQQITPANELVPLNYQVSIGRCNNKTTLPNIPCPKECRIVGKILKDHALSNALTATADDIIYTPDMFRTALKIPTAIAEKPFILPVDFPYIKEFLKILGYQGQLQRVSAFFVKNLAQPWQTMFKVFNRCLTSRMTGHDQTKINVMQIFHVVVNKVHVDY
ncbi:hypothetical protein Tco_0337392 [Tanacetum coccineum]